jgi:subtilase family serine protease
MTRSELEQLTECGHDLAAKVALAIIAAAQVGPCNMEVQVDMETLATVSYEVGVTVEIDRRIMSSNWNQYCINLTFMEVDAVIYARVNR